MIATALWLAFMPAISHAQAGHDESGAPQKDSIAPDQQEFLDAINKIVAHGNLQDVAFISNALKMKYSVTEMTGDNRLNFTFRFPKDDRDSYAELRLGFPRSGTYLNQAMLDNRRLALLIATSPKDGCIPVSYFDGWSSEKRNQVTGERSMRYEFYFGLKRTDSLHQLSLNVGTNPDLTCAVDVVLNEYTGEFK